MSPKWKRSKRSDPFRFFLAERRHLCLDTLRIVRRRSLILALDTSTAACTVALIAPDGAIVSASDEVIGRGHAERLAPTIQELLGGHVPTRLLVGVGPGSFTGLRVGIAAAHGLAIGWSIPLLGMNSLALIAAGAPRDHDTVAVAVSGGHGELFVQSFNTHSLIPLGPVCNLSPDAAAAVTKPQLVVGSGAEALVGARGSGSAMMLLPAASNALRLPELLRMLDCKPIYARAPDARPLVAA